MSDCYNIALGCNFDLFWGRIMRDLTIFSDGPVFKGIVSRDFDWVQMILMNRTWIPDVPLEVYCFLNFRFHIVF